MRPWPGRLVAFESDGEHLDLARLDLAWIASHLPDAFPQATDLLWYAPMVLIVAAVIVLVNSSAPVAERYIEVADLMDSTYWTAPSDALLPEREFDIYQDLPVLFESTEPAEGALL